MRRVTTVGSVIVLGLYILFSDRLVVHLSTGGRGVIPVMALLTPFVIPMLMALNGRVLPPARKFRARLWVRYGHYFLLAALLPFLGVIFYDFPLRSLFGLALDPLVMISFVVLGIWFGTLDSRNQALIDKSVVVMIVFEAVYAIILAQQRAGNIALPFVDYLVEWDSQSQLIFSERYLVEGRAIGTYINPNELGICLGIFFWWIAFHTSGMKRILYQILIAVALILAESRASIIALFICILVSLLVNLWGWVTRSSLFSPRRLSVFSLLGAIGLAALTALLVYSGQLPISDRLQQGISVFSRGVSADENLSGRVQVWEKAPDVLAKYPFGTFGPPESVVNSFIDSEYVQHLLRGGVIFLTSYIAVLLCTMITLRSGLSNERCIAYIAVFMAVNAVAALPLMSPAAALFWVGVGNTMRDS